MHDEKQDINSFKMFEFSIGYDKNVEEIKFNIDAPMLKYCQNTSDSFYLLVLHQPLKVLTK